MNGSYLGENTPHARSASQRAASPHSPGTYWRVLDYSLESPSHSSHHSTVSASVNGTWLNHKTVKARGLHPGKFIPPISLSRTLPLATTRPEPERRRYGIGMVGWRDVCDVCFHATFLTDEISELIFSPLRGLNGSTSSTVGGWLQH